MVAPIIAVALAAAAAIRGAPDLNAPLDTRPTLATEIRRGWVAAEGCAIDQPPLELDRCIGDLVQDEQTRNGHADPFVLGALLDEWFLFDLRLKANATIADNPVAQAEASEDRRLCASAALVAAALQRKLGLTDRQLFAAAEIAALGVPGRWAFWQAQPLASIAYPDAPASTSSANSK